MDEIIVMTNGVISEHGTYQELLSHCGPFADFINSYLTEASNELADEGIDGVSLSMQMKVVMMRLWLFLRSTVTFIPYYHLNIKMLLFYNMCGQIAGCMQPTRYIYVACQCSRMAPLIFMVPGILK